MRKKIYLKKQPKKTKKFLKLTSVLLMGAGFLLIVLALWPILSFDIIFTSRFISLVKPVPEAYLIKPQRAKFDGISFLTNKSAIVEASDSESAEIDDAYTKASIWFPQKPAIKISQEDSIFYTISIPKLGIKDANVIYGSEDLNKSMIQYGGTAFPGDYGNTVIFCHSVLPYFFNPKSYKTICSTVPSLSEGDEIFATYQSITYRYVVIEMHVVYPNDVSLLEQRYDDSYLSLVTCVPPGTYEKRLWVKAKLEKI